jgi:hypothetical protein
MKRIFAKKCDWCNTELILNGKESDTYVINAEHKLFCLKIIQGKQSEKDCMSEYLKAQPKKPKLTDKNTAIKKLNDLKKFLNNKKSESRTQLFNIS